jgi:uridine phosphorylase
MKELNALDNATNEGMAWDVGLRIPPNENVGKIAILFRDEFDEKARLVANYLKDVRVVSEFRGQTTWIGFLDGVRICVVATGWGSASASVTVEELANLGIEKIIRFGTGASLQKDVESGSIVICEGAIRGDGASREYIPIDYPAVASFEITEALVNAAKKLGLPFRLGITRTHDAFFVETMPHIVEKRSPASLGDISYKGIRDTRLAPYLRGGVLVLENEASTTFVVSKIRGVKAGVYCIPTGSFATGKCLTVKEARKSVAQAIPLAIEAARILIQTNKQ